MKKFEETFNELNEAIDGHLEPIPHYDTRELGDKLTKELQIGIEVEKEHQNLYNFFNNFCKTNKLKMPITEQRFFTIIAQAHLKEIKDYYTRLKQMESEAKTQK